ncbi:MAG: TerC family protein [Acidobacteria bacterium]|nr:TerC family protein [Acidobacteriota bacterium]
MPPSIAPPWLWIAFTIFIVSMLALDLVLHRKPRERRGQALMWVIGWVSLALVFYVGIHINFGRQPGLEFITGYVIEYSLSVDNLFIFVLIFRYFSIPAHSQHRILFWGILGALVMRFIFVFLGSALLHRFEWIIYIFGGVVILGGLKMLKEEEIQVDPERNLILRIVRRFIHVSSQDGEHFLIRSHGRVYATKLLLVLVMVEATDLVFAVDSIPAVFAITRDPFIVYSSNIFAILGLRSLYFLIAHAIERFHYLKYGLGLVLIFVGLKMMLAEYFPISTGRSLLVVGALLGGSLVLSLLRTRHRHAAEPQPSRSIASAAEESEKPARRKPR